MNENQYRAAAKRLNQTIVGFAPRIGVSRRQSQRFADGTCPIPSTVVRQIRLIEQMKKIADGEAAPREIAARALTELGFTEQEA